MCSAHFRTKMGWLCAETSLYTMLGQICLEHHMTTKLNVMASLLTDIFLWIPSTKTMLLFQSISGKPLILRKAERVCDIFEILMHWLLRHLYSIYPPGYIRLSPNRFSAGEEQIHLQDMLLSLASVWLSQTKGWRLLKHPWDKLEETLISKDSEKEWQRSACAIPLTWQHDIPRGKSFFINLKLSNKLNGFYSWLLIRHMSLNPLLLLLFMNLKASACSANKSPKKANGLDTISVPTVKQPFFILKVRTPHGLTVTLGCQGNLNRNRKKKIIFLRIWEIIYSWLSLFCCFIRSM